jgi:8-oxo-dGTP diphosphatase
LKFEIGYRLWLKKDGRFLLSEGRAKLLRLIREYGSLSRAADEMRMSYRHAWGTIKKIEEALGEKIIYSERGGQEGGTSKLTPEGEHLLEQYELQKNLFDQQLKMLYKRPALATDGIVIIDDKILLIRRGKDPFKDKYALPGGIVEYGETVERCVVREIKEETGIDTRILQLVGVYSDPERDPRGHFVSVVFHLLHVGGELKAGDDAAAAKLFPINRLPELAFDHRKIIDDFMTMKGVSVQCEPK